MNNKILSVVLVAGIATTGFAAVGSANETLSGSIQVDTLQVREIFEKSRNGEVLTSDEQNIFDRAKSHFTKKGHKGFGKRKGLKHLSEEEREALETMTDDEKKAFFDSKKEEMQAKKEARKSVIDTLISGNTLTTEQETIRVEMLEKIESGDGKLGKRDNAEIIEKILKGETLSSDEQVKFEEMQAKRSQREEKKEILQSIRDKVDAGEDLTDEEQNILDEHKSYKKGRHR